MLSSGDAPKDQKSTSLCATLVTLNYLCALSLKLFTHCTYLSKLNLNIIGVCCLHHKVVLFSIFSSLFSPPYFSSGVCVYVKACCFIVFDFPSLLFLFACSYGMRYIAKVLKNSLHKKFPDASEDELLKVESVCKSIAQYFTLRLQASRTLPPSGLSQAIKDSNNVASFPSGRL